MCSNITLGSANDKEQECAQHSTVNDANNECVHNERGQYIQITEGRLNCSLGECGWANYCCFIIRQIKVLPDFFDGCFGISPQSEIHPYHILMTGIEFLQYCQDCILFS